MTTMLDKCAVAGDITQGIDRRGVWTAAITVIGGTSGTAVKLVSSDTVNGEYTDYKTLISAADAETDQYKGFVVDLHGAKKFIKVTGAVMATAVFGDCDHDVKDIAITEGEVPSGADLEDNYEVTITENGEIEITPSSGYDGMKKVTATVNVSGGGGDVPTMWYLWGDNENYLYYLPFETAPDTLDSLQAIYIGYSLIADIELSTREITDYFKYSDTKFGFTDESLRPSERSFTRVTEDIPLSGPVEPNKEVTITKNGVEIIKPSQSKDFGYNSMAQVTVNVNVPIEGGGATKLYAWFSGTDLIYTTTPTPDVGDKVVLSNNGLTSITTQQVYSVTEEGITLYEEGSVYARYPEGDVNLV